MLSDLSTAQFAGKLDQALLKVGPETGVEDLRREAEQALDCGFRTLCLPPVLAPTVRRNYPGLSVSMVVAYPLGLETTASKVYSIQEALEHSVAEFDVVLDLFALRAKNRAKLDHELEALTAALGNRAEEDLKLIIETPVLDPERIRFAVEVISEHRPAFVKTSTGYDRPPTEVEDVELLASELAGTGIGIKASGGIRSLEDAEAMLRAGAGVLGVSGGPELVEAHREAAG